MVKIRIFVKKKKKSSDYKFWSSKYFPVIYMIQLSGSTPKRIRGAFQFAFEESPVLSHVVQYVRWDSSFFPQNILLV